MTTRPDYQAGDIVDFKYLVEGPCNASGGMGMLLFVRPTIGKAKPRLTLKYCRETNPEEVKRFRREVRLLVSYDGNSKVVQVVDHNLEHDPPYFVMPYYKDGDLTSVQGRLASDPTFQEQVFSKMIDCISELHDRQHLHRDIKPQNFLRDGEAVLVADFGLSTELGSLTGLTTSSQFWGTHGYLPPEFLARGGFRDATPSGDIFMLGKSFYVLVTGRDPLYLTGDGVPAPLFHLIQKCCATDSSARYQSLAELRQAMKSVYDVILGRRKGIGLVSHTLELIATRIKTEGAYQPDEVVRFVDELALTDSADQIRICSDLSTHMFQLLGQKPVQGSLSTFLDIYRAMVEESNYPWSFAETIAAHMKILFDSPSVSATNKATALELALYAAIRQNRFAAMDTCEAMILSVADEQLGYLVGEKLKLFAESFLTRIQEYKCRSEAIRNALRVLRDGERNK